MAEPAELTIEQRISNIFSPEEKATPTVAPASDASQPESAPVEASDEQAPVAEDTPDEAPPETPSEPLVEFTHNDKTYKLPESAAKAFEETRAMATQVAQRTAELKRQLDTREQALQLRQEFEKATDKEVNELRTLEYQIKQYKALDWTQMDSDTMIRAKHQLDLLNDARNEKTQELNGKYQEFSQKHSQLKQEAIAKGVDYLRRSISGFGQKHTESITNYAVSNGYSKAEIDEAMDPRILRDLWKAAQWDALQASKGAAVQKGASAPAMKPTASNPMPSEVKDRLSYQKAIKSATTSQAKAKVIEDRLTRMFK